MEWPLHSDLVREVSNKRLLREALAMTLFTHLQTANCYHSIRGRLSSVTEYAPPHRIPAMTGDSCNSVFPRHLRSF
jgi:hypothetical protein